MTLYTRSITPHKNGRTERVDMRATGSEKSKIIRYAKRRKMSIIDAVLSLIDAEEKRAEAEANKDVFLITNL